MARVKKIRVSIEALVDLIKKMNDFEECPEENQIPDCSKVIDCKLEAVPPTVSAIQRKMDTKAMKEIVITISAAEFPETSIKEAPDLAPHLSAENEDKLMEYLRQAMRDLDSSKKMAYMMAQNNKNADNTKS